MPANCIRPFQNRGANRGETIHSGQVGRSIHIFSRIAMAADTFVHLLHHEGQNMPNVIALHKIQQEPFVNWIEPEVMQELLTVVPPFLPGMAVKMTDRRDAVVTQYDINTPCYPTVQILDGIDAKDDSPRESINLANEKKLAIANVDGFDVSTFLYGNRATAVASAAR